MGSVNDVKLSGLQRRDFLSYLGAVPVGLSATSWLGLTACGGSSNTAYPTKITFIASSSPATDADKALVFTEAKINVAYSDNTTATSA